MNLILFEPGELDSPLPGTDPRAMHVLKVLRRQQGDAFDAGIVDGPRGKATLLSITSEGLSISFEPGPLPAAADPVHLLIAMPRPQTARKILGEATSLGLASMRFFPSEKGEPSYASSALWQTAEWRRHLLQGAAQAFDTRLPQVVHGASLAEVIAGIPADCLRIALDNYEATRRLTHDTLSRPLALAFGPERGWSAAERTLLRESGFELAHLGPRVLRTETAVAAALAIAKAGS